MKNICSVQIKWLLLGAKTRKGDMKYYSQYRIHDLFELQESLLGLSKSNRWVKLADRLPWAKIEKEYTPVRDKK